MTTQQALHWIHTVRQIEAILLNMVIRLNRILHWHWKEENKVLVRKCERDNITSYSLDPYCDDV